eukprot:619299-Prymnesium_polylepis.3
MYTRLAACVATRAVVPRAGLHCQLARAEQHLGRNTLAAPALVRGLVEGGVILYGELSVGGVAGNGWL